MALFEPRRIEMDDSYPIHSSATSTKSERVAAVDFEFRWRERWSATVVVRTSGSLCERRKRLEDERMRWEELLGSVGWEWSKREREMELLARWNEIEGWDRRRTYVVDL